MAIGDRRARVTARSTNCDVATSGLNHGIRIHEYAVRVVARTFAPGSVDGD